MKRKFRVYDRRKNGAVLQYPSDADKGALRYFRRIADAHCPEQVDDDREWFEQHPHKCARLREAYPSEHVEFGQPPPGGKLIVEVVQLHPGFRIRRGAYWAVPTATLNQTDTEDSPLC